MNGPFAVTVTCVQISEASRPSRSCVEQSAGKVKRSFQGRKADDRPADGRWDGGSGRQRAAARPTRMGGGGGGKRGGESPRRGPRRAEQRFPSPPALHVWEGGGGGEVRVSSDEPE